MKRTAEVFKNKAGSWTVYIGEGWTTRCQGRRVVARTVACLPLLEYRVALSVATTWVDKGFGVSP